MEGPSRGSRNGGNGERAFSPRMREAVSPVEGPEAAVGYSGSGSRETSGMNDSLLYGSLSLHHRPSGLIRNRRSALQAWH